MLIVQKLTMVAYALHDGRSNYLPHTFWDGVTCEPLCCKGKARKESSLNVDQKLQRITAPPTVLEYFCYVFNFHSLLAGPSCTIHEFLAFMDGSNFQPMDNPNAYALVSIRDIYLREPGQASFFNVILIFFSG